MTIETAKASAMNSKTNRTSGNTRVPAEELSDFTATSRTLPISLLAIVIGAVCAYVALALLKLIGLLTSLFYFGR